MNIDQVQVGLQVVTDLGVKAEVAGFERINRWLKVKLRTNDGVEFVVMPSKFELASTGVSLAPIPEPEPVVEPVIPAFTPKRKHDILRRGVGREDTDFDRELDALTLDETYARCVKDTGMLLGILQVKYAKLGAGLQKMNLCNRIRAAARKAGIK